MSNKKEPVKKSSWKAYLDESNGVERDLIAEVLKSRRIAWIFAAAMTALAFMGVGAGIAGLSQEVPDPAVLRVDNATGHVDVVSKIDDQSSYQEIVDEYWINQYLINRESYDYDTIQQTYDTTALFSGDRVQREYLTLFQGANALDEKLKNRTRILVDVRSIEPNGKGQATARFKTKRVHSNGVEEKPKHWVAHIAYEYVRAPMKLSARRINPLGFQVTSYRTYPEVVAE